MAEFNLEGLLGSAFGGGGGNVLDEYLTPEQRASMQRNAMLAASAALLKAGGESTRRIGIGEALGGAFEAGQAGYEKAQTGALTQMALKQKMEEAKKAKALNAQLASIMGLSTPGEMESPEVIAKKLMQSGRAAMSAGDFTRGFDFYKQAREVNPRDEVQGGLTQLTDESGKPIMVQQFKSGKVVTAPGYGPPREMVLQDVGGKLIAIDKNAATTGSELTLGMTPYQQFQSNLELEKLGMSRQDLDAKLKNDAQRLSISERELALAVKRFGLNEQEFARGNYQIEQAENGNFVYVSKVPGMPSIPVPGTGGNQLSVGITPMQKADLDIQLRRIGLSEAEFARGNYEVKEADNGTLMYVSKVPGMPAIPVMGAGGNPLTVGISPTEQARLNISLQQLGLSKQEFDQKVKQDALRMGIDQQQLGLAVKRFKLSADEFARGNYAVKETENGFAYVPTVPGLPIIPIMGGGNEPLKGKSEAPAAFSEASRKLNNLKGNISAYKAEINSDKTVFPSEVPLPFGAKIPLPTGEDTARLRGKYQSLLMGVKDLYELGALTGPDMGIISEQLTNPASFAGMFTSRAAMKEQIKVLEDMAGRAEENLSSTYKRKIPAASTSGIGAAPPVVPGAGGSGLTWDPAQKKFVNR